MQERSRQQKSPKKNIGIHPTMIGIPTGRRNRTSLTTAQSASVRYARVSPVRQVNATIAPLKTIYAFVDQLLNEENALELPKHILWDSGATHALLLGDFLYLVPESR